MQSNNSETTRSIPWYEQYEKVVQWITLLSVVTGAGLHYLLVDRQAVNAQHESLRLTLQLIEESKRNQQLIEQKLQEAHLNAEVLRANIDHMKAQIALSSATIEQMQNPTRRASDGLQLERQRLERIRLTDELVDSLIPNFQVTLVPESSTWRDRYVSVDFKLANLGARPIHVDPPQLFVTPFPVQGADSKTLPNVSKLKVTMCSAGFITPGETIVCEMGLSSDVSLSTVGHMSFRAEFMARTDLPEESETSKRVRAAYKKEYLALRMSKSVSFDATLWR